jgi:hypothetical protein
VHQVQEVLPDVRRESGENPELYPQLYVPLLFAATTGSNREGGKKGDEPEDLLDA